VLRTFASTALGGTCILDVGCHVGDTAFKLAAVLPEDVLVIAVDPNQSKVRFVKDVIAMNPEHTMAIEPVNAAISDKGSRGAEKHIGQSGSWTVTEEVEDGSVTILTGEQILNGRVPSLLHIDVEGYEYRALLGLGGVIKQHRPAIMIEIKHGTDSGKIRPWLEAVMGYEHIWENKREHNHLFIPRYTFHIVVVCTPNYDHIGQYGVKSLRYYAQLHGYKFTLVREAISGVHVNFTKNSAAIQAMDSSDADFVVNIDADVEVVDVDRTLASLLWSTGVNRDTVVMRAPQDRYCTRRVQNSHINAGFVIWSNTPRAKEINQNWLDLARTEGAYAATQHPRQQNVFDKVLYPTKMNQMELRYLDHESVGMQYSNLFKQTKSGKKGWYRVRDHQSKRLRENKHQTNTQ